LDKINSSSFARDTVDSLSTSMELVSNFAAIFQMKSILPGETYFTAQENWDEPFISLYQNKNGKVIYKRFKE